MQNEPHAMWSTDKKTNKQKKIQQLKKEKKNLSIYF